MNKVRIGMIGCGNIGLSHAKKITEEKVLNAELVAISVRSLESRKIIANTISNDIILFKEPDELLNSGEVDGVIIATPHYFHPELAIKAFERGLHVLTEKPSGVYTRQVEKMNEAALKSGKVFSIMFQMRADPVQKKIKDMLESKELGEIKRILWNRTDCYRSQSYFDMGSWRGTWAGEGGGILINQCSHDLDLMQYFFDMPERIRAFCSFGKYHDIETEDDCTAFMEYENGATCTFIVSTGESPGVNRIEIIGDKGKLLIENGQILFWRNRISERKFNKEFSGGFGEPECWKCEIPLGESKDGHLQIISNWVDAIQNGVELIAPGVEGIKSLELSNAMLLSTWIDNWVKLPIDGNIFHKKLIEKAGKTV